MDEHLGRELGLKHRVPRLGCDDIRRHALLMREPGLVHLVSELVLRLFVKLGAFLAGELLLGRKTLELGTGAISRVKVLDVVGSESVDLTRRGVRAWRADKGSRSLRDGARRMRREELDRLGKIR